MLAQKSLEGKIVSEARAKNELMYIQQKDEFDYLISLIEAIQPGKCAGILLHGPPGTGKTLLAISLAKLFKSTYYIIDGSPDLDRRDIEGNWELINGETMFNYGPLTMAIEDANKNGISFVIINEINAIRENEQISLNSLLSESHINLISKGFEKHDLDPESKLVIIGTMNKGVLGINKMQEAFEDRFISSPEITYPTKPKEVEITTEITGCDKKLAEIVVDAARQIRKQAVQDYSLTKIFSTRLIVNFCSLLNSMPHKFLKNNIENGIINKLGNTPEEKKSIAMILDGKMFEKKLKAVLTNGENIENFKEMDIDDVLIQNTINEFKLALDEFILKFGKEKLFNINGTLMWKPFKWLWDNKKQILTGFMKLTEKVDYPNIYKQETKKDYFYGGKLTLSYIKWLYEKKASELLIFMKEIYPVI